MSSARKPGASARSKGASAFTAGGSARPTSSARPKTSSSRPTSSSSSRPASSGSKSGSKPKSSSKPSSYSSSSKQPMSSSITSSTNSKVSSSSRKARSGDSKGSRGRDAHVPGATKQAPQQGLMEIVHKRFTEDVFNSAAKAHPGWKVLIVDEPGMKVVSAAVGMYDIMEQQVSIVESLEKVRAPFKDMAAIYILSPTRDSINRLLKDYEDKTTVLYGKAVFLYFLGPVPQGMMQELKQCKQLIKRLKAMAEINVDFLIREQRAFILDMNDPFASFFRGSGRKSVELKTAQKLVTLCATLFEYPYIRYKQDSKVCSRIASIFKKKMDQFVSANPSWWYQGSGNCPTRNAERDRSTLLLLDRSSDCLTPLLHDFNYQAMVNDLLDINGDKITYKADIPDNPKKKEEKDVLLNEKDKLWVEMRGDHVAKVIEVLTERIQEVMNSSTSMVARKDKNMSLAQLASAMKDLPEYREVTSKLNQHMHIAHGCMDKFTSGGLYELGDLEQTLATGKDEDDQSTKLSETISRCESALLNIKSPKDRLRLVLIAIISQGGLTTENKESLFRAANLGRKELALLDSLIHIGIQSVNDNPTPVATKEPQKGGFLGGFRNRTSSQDSEEENEYTSSRYVPPLKKILKDLVTNQLSIDDYPSVIPMPLMVNSTSTGIASSARRRGKAESNNKKKGGATDKWGKKQKDSGPTHYDGGRNIVFMVGGLSFAELRVVRNVMEKEEREIIAGSTKFISPNSFISDLKTLAKESKS